MCGLTCSNICIMENDVYKIGIALYKDVFSKYVYRPNANGYVLTIGHDDDNIS